MHTLGIVMVLVGAALLIWYVIVIVRAAKQAELREFYARCTAEDYAERYRKALEREQATEFRIRELTAELRQAEELAEQQAQRRAG